MGQTARHRRLSWTWVACSVGVVLLAGTYVWAQFVSLPVQHRWVENREYWVSPPKKPVVGPRTGVLLDNAQALENELKAQLSFQGFTVDANTKLGVRHFATTDPQILECWPALPADRPPFSLEALFPCLGLTSFAWDTSVREGIMIKFDNLGRGPTTLGSFIFTWPGEEVTPAITDGSNYGFIPESSALKSIAANNFDNHAQTAGELFNQVPNATSISRFEADSGALFTYTGTTPTTNFDLERGTAYLIQVFPAINPPIKVSGKLFADANASTTFDTGEEIAGRRVQFTDGATGNTRLAISDAAGAYLGSLGPGDWTITVPAFGSELWAPAPIALGPQTTGTFSGNDFYRSQIDDLSVSLFYRPGPPNYLSACSTSANPADRVTDFCVNYRNTGDHDESGAIVRLELPPDPTQVLYSTLNSSHSCSAAAPSTPIRTGSVVEWMVPSFPRQTECTVCLGLEVAAPIGDTLSGTVRIRLPGNTPDAFTATANDDTHTIRDSCAVDPNDLQVSPSGCGARGQIVEQDLTYLTRFQNTGNAAAIDVVIRHTVDPSLDLTTLQLLETSHPLTSLEIEDGRQLVWTFENINLPDETSDPEGSNGYLLYRIAPKPGLPVGTEIANAAAIVFDLNDSVVTNTVINTIAADTDGDGTVDPCDNCESIANQDQADVDTDSVGDLCDNCVTDANPDQADADSDLQGDVCDPCTDADVDGYGSPGGVACLVGPETDCDDLNPATFPGAVEICDDDDNDCDGRFNEGFGALPELCNNIDDNCNGLVDEGNPEGGGACFIGSAFGECRFGTQICLSEFSSVACFQSQGPGPEICGNGVDDDCDGLTDEATDDTDGDQIDNCLDNCADAFNPAQLDTDGDGDGDACDCAPGDGSNPMPDPIGDTLRVTKSETGETTLEWDAIGEASYNAYRGFVTQAMPFGYNQECLLSGVPEAVPLTRGVDPLTPRILSTFFYLVTSTCTAGNTESDVGRDSDGVLRPMPFTCPALTTDFDGDGVDNAIDNCLDFRNGSQSDTDVDGVGDVCDNCVEVFNPPQADLDGDGIGDACDPDSDGDSVPEGDGSNPCTAGATIKCDDNCPDLPNPAQDDPDADGVGSDCDNCPDDFNPGQEDADNDEIGDACE